MAAASLAFPFRVFVDVVRGTPVLVLILASYYMPSGLGVSPGPITAGIIALTVFCASHVGETLRGALHRHSAGADRRRAAPSA